MRYRIALLLCAAVWVLSACNLSSTGPQAAPTPTGAASGKPVVTILSPQDGAEVIVNEQILVSVSASDAVGVTRVQLYVNDGIVKTVSSETPGGDPNLNVLLDYTPDNTGSMTLQVIAYRGAIASDPAEITVTVRQNQAQVTATMASQPNNIPVIDPYDPTCRLLVNTGLNYRTGPGIVYDRISVLSTGTVAPITGRTGDNTWWQIRVGVSTGWVSGGYVTLYGNCSNVIVPPIPPTPTPHVTATVTPLPPTNTLTTTVQPSTATPTPGLPDLVVTNFSLVGGTSLTLGGDPSVTGTFSVTVTNTGASPTGQFNNLVNVNPPDADTPIAVVAGLNPGESIVLNFDLSFTAAGNYNLQVRADSDNQITEVSEVNNSANLTLVVNP